MCVVCRNLNLRLSYSIIIAKWILYDQKIKNQIVNNYLLINNIITYKYLVTKYLMTHHISAATKFMYIKFQSLEL